MHFNARSKFQRPFQRRAPLALANTELRCFNARSSPTPKVYCSTLKVWRGLWAGMKAQQIVSDSISSLSCPGSLQHDDLNEKLNHLHPIPYHNTNCEVPITTASSINPRLDLQIPSCARIAPAARTHYMRQSTTYQTSATCMLAKYTLRNTTQDMQGPRPSQQHMTKA